MSHAPQSYDCHHDSLGEIKGITRGEHIVQFRGIAYASIPARFRQSELVEQLPQVPFDATQPGPICPQKLLPFPDYWDAANPVDIPVFPAVSQSESDCLNLSITTPRKALGISSPRLPVLVFIHGGAFVGGSQTVRVGSREIYDGTGTVRGSLDLGLEVVVVTLNYRVGPLGFLASEELTSFNKSHNENVGNYGLHDQRQALIWIQRFISGFGGDPDNVTIYGTSAGGASCHYQCIFRERQFKRAIISSATMFGIGAMPLEHCQKTFDQFKAYFADGQEDVVAAMQDVAVRDFVDKIQINLCTPLIEHDWILEDRLHGWEDDINAPDMMIGACAHELEIAEAILSSAWDVDNPKPHDDEAILSQWQETMSSNGVLKTPKEVPTAVLTAYDIDATSTKQPTNAMLQWSSLLADCVFRIPYLYTARRNRSPHNNILLYEFKATNPYPSGTSWYGKANHGINDLFIFNTAFDKVPEKHRGEYDGAVREAQRCWLEFCHGRLPWPHANGIESGKEPIYVFENGEQSHLAKGLEEALGRKVAAKWEAVLAWS